MGGSESHTGRDGEINAAPRQPPFRVRDVASAVRRRAFIAAGALALSGCLGRGTDDGATGSSTDDPSDAPTVDPGVGTTTGNGTPTAPLVSWEFSLDRDREVAQVAHGVGEPLTTDRTDRIELVVTTAPDHPVPTDATMTPTATPLVFRTTWRAAGGRYPVEPGDAVTVGPVTPGDTLTVYWYGHDHHREGTWLESVTFEQV